MTRGSISAFEASLYFAFVGCWWGTETDTKLFSALSVKLTTHLRSRRKEMTMYADRDCHDSYIGWNDRFLPGFIVH